MDSAVAKYFAAIPESRKHHVQKLHSLVMRRFPDAELDMRYKIPTYSHGGGWVAIADQKHYVSSLHAVRYTWSNSSKHSRDIRREQDA